MASRECCWSANTGTPWAGRCGNCPPGASTRARAALAGAKRELLEETGITAREWRHAFTFYSSPGFLDETMAIYLARGLTQGAAQPEEDEMIAKRFFPSRAGGADGPERRHPRRQDHRRRSVVRAQPAAAEPPEILSGSGSSLYLVAIFACYYLDNRTAPERKFYQCSNGSPTILPTGRRFHFSLPAAPSAHLLRPELSTGETVAKAMRANGTGPRTQRKESWHA